MKGASEANLRESRHNQLLKSVNALSHRLDASLKLLSVISHLTGIPMLAQTTAEAVQQTLRTVARNLNDIQNGAIYLNDEQTGEMTMVGHLDGISAWDECAAQEDTEPPFPRDTLEEIVAGNMPVFVDEETDVAGKTAYLPLSCSERCQGVLALQFVSSTQINIPLQRDLILLGRVVSNVIHAFLLNKELEQSADRLQDKVRECEEEIEERKQIERALRESEEKHRVLLSTVPDPVVVIDLNGLTTYVNPAFSQLFGWQLQEVQGHRLDYTPLEARGDEELFLRSPSKERIIHGIETKRRTKFGRVLDVLISGGLLQDGDGRPVGRVVTVKDITERKRTEEEIAYLAFHDVITGLPNRKSFYNQLEELLNQSSRAEAPIPWALLFLDLDEFKNVNDTFGHDIGDRILFETGIRLKKCLRKSDHVFRLGGDEFTIILKNLKQSIDAAIVADKINDLIAQSFEIERGRVNMSASIGISVFPTDGDTVEMLIKKADLAMYAAKESRNRYQFYTEEFHARAIERIQLENALHMGLKLNQFTLYYQPMVNPRGRLIGAEALIRWNHPDMGLILPVKFIPLAEETQIIVPIGDWVMLEACRQCQEWHSLGKSELFVSVNVSPKQVRESIFVNKVLDVLEQTGLTPHALVIEVTEGTLMENTEEIIAKMQFLRERGVRFSVDDFGTGYSSLMYLKRLPIDTLKIAKPFVTDSTTSKDDQEIIRAIIALARNLDIRTVAEGVESPDQITMLNDLHCDIMQGFYFGQPMAPCDFLGLLNNLPDDELSCALLATTPR